MIIDRLSKQLWISLFIVVAAMMAACSSDNNSNNEPNPTPTDPVEEQLAQMSLRQKVGQMFVIRPEALLVGMDEIHDVTANAVTQLTDGMVTIDRDYPVGGIILYAHNITTPSQITTFTKQLHSLPGDPLLCIDEEGGRVARIGRNKNFNVPKYASMWAIGATGNPLNAQQAGASIGSYLRLYGFDVDLAPVADVNTNPENVVIGDRAFSDDPDVAAGMVEAFLNGIHSSHVSGCLKHFPGHGDTKTDTHYGYAETKKTWQDMLNCEMVPFIAGIKAGAQFIMTAHIAAPNITGNSDPATMSSVILQDKLRGELGFEGIIITDAMEMGAITSQYTNTEATIGAIKAGVDIILGPHNYKKAFDAVVKAVKNGEISEKRIDESVRRILRVKQARTLWPRYTN